MNPSMSTAMAILVPAAVAAILLLLPRLVRRGLLFGVYVGEEPAVGETARRITTRWYRGMGVTCLLSLGLGLGLSARGHHAPLVSIAVLVAGFVLLYLRSHFEARQIARGGPRPATAPIVEDPPQRILLPWISLALGLGAGLLALAYTLLHYGDLPDRIPVHFDASGAPDAWRERTPMTVLLPPLMTIIMGGGMPLFGLLTAQAKRGLRLGDQGISIRAQHRFRRAVVRFVCVMGLLMTAMLATLSVGSVQVAMGSAPTIHGLATVTGGAAGVFGIAGALYLAIRYGQGGARLERSAADAPLTDGLADNRFWWLGIIYVNREDPSIIVEKRFGVGYTINFGNPLAITIFVGFIALLLSITVLGA